MNDNIDTTVQSLQEVEHNKVISLFKFIKELNALKQKAILNISAYPWARTISSLPDDPENIEIFYQDRTDIEEIASTENITLLSVHKPEYERCPAPDAAFSDWLNPGWDLFRNEVSIILQRPMDASSPTTSRTADTNEEDTLDQFEHFEDDETRVAAYEKWIVVRKAWVERQQILSKTRSLFSDLYRLFFDLQRDSETMELIVANGTLCDRKNTAIKHPVLTKRVKLRFDPTENTIYVDDAETSSELYLIALQIMEDINLNAINKLREDLQENDYHPLDRNDTPEYLKILVHQLSSDSSFSIDGVPEKWMSSNRLLLYWDPCFIMRKRLDGTLKAIEQIIENVQETGYIPEPIREIVSGGKVEIPEDTGEETVEEQLASVGGESVDVLLSKEANKEQLEIAKRIELYNAVLVQGPPGTGKTHTIANLMGHFLAQGKSVLVTSQTPKALTVLKDKVAPGLRNLCVSVLEDSNIDMERSIDGITDYMSRTTSHELKRDVDILSIERKKIIDDLAHVRRNIFQIINQECNCIVYNGEELSPSKAAAFVVEHASDLSYIPGKVRTGAALPLSFDELSSLYRSNETISDDDELELDLHIPAPYEILSGGDFSQCCKDLELAREKVASIQKESSWTFEFSGRSRQISFHSGLRTLSVNYPNEEAIDSLETYAADFKKVDDWMKYAAVDGKNGGAYRNRWETLMQTIEKTCQYAEDILEEQFGIRIEFQPGHDIFNLIAPYQKLCTIFEQKGKLSKLTLLLNKDCADVLDVVHINGKPVASAHDCKIVLHMIELAQLRKLCSTYWDELLSVHRIPHFTELDPSAPERIALNWIPVIKRYLNWYQTDYSVLLEHLRGVNIDADRLFASNALDSETVATEKILETIITDIPVICDACRAVLLLDRCQQSLTRNQLILENGSRCNSSICHNISLANSSRNVLEYDTAYISLCRVFEKYDLQAKRREWLARLEPIAPQWAAAIQNREGVHGIAILPDTIDEAWKWKQLSAIIEEITTQPFDELQRKSISLSKQYRKVTARYAEKCAWYHLLTKTEGDIDMRHALQGWKQTVKKIGKGTGKNAPMLKAKARELMSKCQSAVPSWIMPINRALDSLDPKVNRFDVVIIDEASQSDISSLAILYMGKKLIIVGDDKQVSPMAVGVEIDKMNSLQQMYIQDRIPNSHLYDAKTSIYDIAKTTFQPLMLREHFRCVPEIIGFSNMLSYNYEIKPLRDASDSTLLPAVVNYRVADGKRLSNKTNPTEARSIVALLQACIEQPEYTEKTFGVISLLGDEQVKVIQQLLEEEIGHKELVERSILCGNASHFQGDERDVVFLSVVDSSDGSGPVRLQGFGTDDAFRKRYNVAASRARDQLWVVDSLDSATDLKPGDIRKTLIDYSLNPSAVEYKHSEIERKAESPFEIGVATALSDRGYHLVQQWPVGAYRLDMVAVYGKKTVAIECDGERFHSGEAKVREDMERQTILERLGWRFIRIRGSEYFRNPEKTIERVVDELSSYGISPEMSSDEQLAQTGSELLSRIKLRAAQILEEQHSDDQTLDLDTIAAALDSKSMLPQKTVTAATESSMEKTSHASEPEDKTPSKEPMRTQSAQQEQRVPAAKREIRIRKNSTHKQSQEKLQSKSQKVSPSITPEQMKIPGMESDFDLIAAITVQKIQYVDKRDKGGSLWIIGGKELNDFVTTCKLHGIRFTFKSDGSRATKGKPGWWTST